MTDVTAPKVCNVCGSKDVFIGKYGKWECGHCGHRWIEEKQVTIFAEYDSDEQETSEFDGILGIGDEDALFPPTF